MKKLLQLVAVVAVAFPMLAAAHGPTRQKAVEKVQINAAPEKVWAMVKDFGAIDKWHPAVKKCVLKDAEHRVLSIGAEDGPTITEELKSVNDDKMMFKYKIVDMSVTKTVSFNGTDVPYYTLPVNNYTSQIIVKAKDGGSEVTWKGHFYRSFMLNPPVPEGQSDEDAVKAVSAVYRQGLDNLKVVMEK